ncbi:MAG: LysR family transcriptional regulator [Nocardioides sp.]
MGMDIEVLRWFQHVADGTTVTEVAEVFGVSQPAVSRSLARLDKDIGTPLLEKHGRLLRPTHAGTAFKAHVDRALHGLDDGLAAVEQLLDPETGTVTLAFQLSLGSWLIPELVAGFQNEHPRVSFRFEQSIDGRSPVLQPGKNIDMEFSSRRPTEPGIHWRPILTEELMLAVPPGHRFATMAGIDLGRAAGESFVSLRPTWELRRRSEELCANAGFVPRVAHSCDALPTVMGFVAAGLGVAIVPRVGADPDRRRPDEARLLTIHDAGATREIGLCWLAERALLPAAELFRRFALHHASARHRDN